MTPYEPLAADIQVNGRTVFSVVDAFSVMRRIPARMLLAEGIGLPEGRDGIRIDPDAWYDHAAWLRTFRRISLEIGVNALQQIGLKIPANAEFPPDVDTIGPALRSIDVAYHLNHRRDGRPMFEMDTGAMTEGIGHYHCDVDDGLRRARLRCDNPYPCDFDMGIVTCIARRFEFGATVDHERTGCRNTGAAACDYVVRW